MAAPLAGPRLQQFKFYAADAQERLIDAETIAPLWRLLEIAALRRQLAAAPAGDREGLRQAARMLEGELTAGDPRAAFAALTDHAQALARLAAEYLGPGSPREGRGHEAPAETLMDFLHGIDALHALAAEAEDEPDEQWRRRWQHNAAHVARTQALLSPPGKLEAALSACRALLSRPDAQLPGPPPEPPFTFRWRVHPADHPDQTVAELLFTQEPDADEGKLAVTADDPDLRGLIQYFLADAQNTRPLFFRDTGTIPGPHTRTFGQIDRSLLDFNRRYPQWRAERAD